MPRPIGVGPTLVGGAALPDVVARHLGNALVNRLDAAVRRPSSTGYTDYS